MPALERRLVEAQTTLGLREQKQLVLLDLIAGRDRIQTFLALLGQEAWASGVEIRRYEPLAAPSFSNVDRTAIAVVRNQPEPEAAKDPDARAGLLPVFDRVAGDGGVRRIAAVSSADGAIAAVGGKQ